jgi:small-conductance mechanosensitive channel
VQDGRPIDLTAQVARVKRKARPWTAIFALLLAVAAAVVSEQARHDSHFFFRASHVTDQIVADATAVLFLVFGSTATYGLAGKSRQLLEPKVGAPHSAVVRYTILIVGAFTTLLVTLVLFDVSVGQLVLGGALGTVFVGIAAQQALGNVFAGLVLLFARPFRVGDAIRLRAGALGGTLDGTVTDIGITYVRFETGDGIVAVPNLQVLNATVGPIPPGEQEGQGQVPAGYDGKPAVPGGPAPGPQEPRPSPPGPA